MDGWKIDEIQNRRKDETKDEEKRREEKRREEKRGIALYSK